MPLASGTLSKQSMCTTIAREVSANNTMGFLETGQPELWSLQIGYSDRAHTYKLPEYSKVK